MSDGLQHGKQPSQSTLNLTSTMVLCQSCRSCVLERRTGRRFSAAVLSLDVEPSSKLSLLNRRTQLASGYAGMDAHQPAAFAASLEDEGRKYIDLDRDGFVPGIDDLMLDVHIDIDVAGAVLHRLLPASLCPAAMYHQHCLDDQPSLSNRCTHASRPWPMRVGVSLQR